MKTTCVFRLYLALVAALAFTPGASAQEPVLDKDYKLITPQQQPESAKKVEVIEFFSYACPHCADFEPALQRWLKHKPKDVEYRMYPMVFRESWKAPAKLYYALEAMGLVEKYHEQVYDAIHKQNKELATDNQVKQWAASMGIDAAKFNQVYDSFGIDAKLQHSVAMGRAYGVQGTPAMAVNGKYYTAPSMVMAGGGALDYDRFFKVLDQLIEMEHPSAASKRKKTG